MSILSELKSLKVQEIEIVELKEEYNVSNETNKKIIDSTTPGNANYEMFDI